MNRDLSAARRKLPRWVAPMLTQPAMPFDSDDFLFEVKWDGARALAFIEYGSLRLLSRHGLDRSARYPELAGLAHGGCSRRGIRDCLGKPSFRRPRAAELVHEK